MQAIEHVQDTSAQFRASVYKQQLVNHAQTVLALNF